MKNLSRKLVQAFFNFQRIVCKKESEDVCILIWHKSDSFPVTYLLQVTCFRKLIS